MNILFLINYAGNAGTERYVEVLCDNYVRMGHRCFLCYNLPGKLSRDLSKKGIYTYQLDLSAKHAGKSAKLLGEYCKKYNVELIHAQYPRENVIAVKAKKYCNARVVFTSHLSIKQGIKWEILNRLYAKEDHAVIGLFDDAKSLLVSNGIPEDKIKIIYNGVERQNTHVHYSVAPFTMTIMARYVEDKGLDFLLDILSDLKTKTDKKFVCNILGEGELFDHIKERIEKEDLSSIVNQVGFTANTKEYLKNTNLYLCTSKANEAMSFGILEALSFGIPCVTTNVGGSAILAKDCGECVEYGDVQAFSSAILRFMNDWIYWQDCSKKAIEKTDNEFSLERLSENTLKAYR